MSEYEEAKKKVIGIILNNSFYGIYKNPPKEPINIKTEEEIKEELREMVERMKYRRNQS